MAKSKAKAAEAVKEEPETVEETVTEDNEEEAEMKPELDSEDVTEEQTEEEEEAEAEAEEAEAEAEAEDEDATEEEDQEEDKDEAEAETSTTKKSSKPDPKQLISTIEGNPELRLQNTSVRTLLEHNRKTKIWSFRHPECVISGEGDNQKMHMFYGKHEVSVPYVDDAAEFDDGDDEEIVLIPEEPEAENDEVRKEEVASDEKKEEETEKKEEETEKKEEETEKKEEETVKKPKYRFKSSVVGTALINKYACSHEMLKLLGYPVPETEIPGKYHEPKDSGPDGKWRMENTKWEMKNLFLKSTLPDQPDLQKHFQSSPMTYVLLHAKVKGITSEYKIVEITGKKFLRLTHGDKEEHAEISKTINGNDLRMEKAYFDVSEKLLCSLGYDKRWKANHQDPDGYVCTIKSTNEDEPDLPYFKNQSMFNILESNMRMKSRLKGTSERKNAPRYTERLQEDKSRWVRFSYVGQEYEEKIRDQDEPYSELKVLEVKQKCAQKALEFLGYDVSVIPKTQHDLLYRRKNPPQYKKNAPAGVIYTLKNKNTRQPEIHVFKKENVHNYVSHLNNHHKKSRPKMSAPNFKKIPHPNGSGFELHYANKVFREFASYTQKPSSKDAILTKNILARKALLVLGYRPTAWREGDNRKKELRAMMEMGQMPPHMRGGMRGGPSGMRGGPQGMWGGPMGPRGGPRGQKRPNRGGPGGRQMQDSPAAKRARMYQEQQGYYGQYGYGEYYNPGAGAGAAYGRYGGGQPYGGGYGGYGGGYYEGGYW